jgi:hypothetical protein
MRLSVFLEPQQGASYDDQLRVARRRLMHQLTGTLEVGFGIARVTGQPFFPRRNHWGADRLSVEMRPSRQDDHHRQQQCTPRQAMPSGAHSLTNEHSHLTMRGPNEIHLT